MQISCTVNLAAGAIEVFSPIDPTDASHQRMHFCAALTKVQPATIADGALKPRASTLAALLRVKKVRISASAAAGVAMPHDARSFYVHPTAGEATLQLASAHPAAAASGLRVAAKVEAARLTSLGTTTNAAPWAVGMLTQGGKRNGHRLLGDGTAVTVCLDGVETRRLVTERPPMQQPRQVFQHYIYHSVDSIRLHHIY